MVVKVAVVRQAEGSIQIDQGSETKTRITDPEETDPEMIIVKTRGEIRILTRG